MKITRKWLEEFIDLSGINTQDIINVLNKIGQEVEGYEKIEIPQNVVIGEVLECQKHPDADKLNICRVNVGDEEVQIVCGAKNVAAGQFVPVALIGAVLPGDFKIKKAKLRGVESFGMICASREIGLPDFHDGIMVMDNSLGELKIGEYAGIYLNDEIIELGITANRGDCFSVYGIARELSAGLNKNLKSFEAKYEELQEGIGRIVNIDKYENKNSSHLLKAVEGNLEIPLKIDYRLALLDIESKNKIEKFAKYTMQATGVLITPMNICNIELDNEKGVDIVKCFGEYYVGIKNEINIEENGKYLIDANYISPKDVNEAVFLNNLKTDDYFFRASRGCEPDLKFGMDYMLSELKILVYGGTVDLSKEIDKKVINININEIRKIIGFDIDEKTIVEILKKLGFEIKSISDNDLKISIPLFRHDIENIQDIAEEILRIYGIDNICSKALAFQEKNRINKTFEDINYLNELKLKAVSQGFYEVLHFVFEDKQRLEKYGFDVIDDNVDLLNPIVKELDTLRSTILLQLLDDVKYNKSNDYKQIFLFSAGSTYDKKRNENQKITFVINGFRDYENPTNSGKPTKVNFKDIVDKISQIIGEINLVEGKHPIAHPYQCADVIQDNKKIGIIAKLHPKVAKEFDIDDTYFCEISFDKISKKEKKAKEINKFQKVIRDLSLVASKDLTYKYILDTINSLSIKELKEVYPIDVFDLGKNNSITLRFKLQAEKTLQENEINDIMEKILKVLEDKGITLR